MSRFPVALRRTGIRFLGILVPPGSWAFVASGLPERLAASRTLTGFPRSACASSDRGGRPLDPEASGVHTTGENCPAAACRSSTARPCTPVLIPSAGALGNEASAGVHSRSPVRSSPRLRSRMERERFGFFPELRTPQLPAAHVRAGTGLEHWPEAMPPTSSALQPASSLAPCDLVSHVLNPVIASKQPQHVSRSQHRIPAAVQENYQRPNKAVLTSPHEAGHDIQQRSTPPYLPGGCRGWFPGTWESGGAGMALCPLQMSWPGGCCRRHRWCVNL